MTLLPMARQRGKLAGHGAGRRSVSIWPIGFSFFLKSYWNHRIFGTFYALVLVLSYGKLGHFRVKWPDFPIYSIFP